MDFLRQLESLQQLVGELIRVGIVTTTNAEKGTARVQFKDRNEVVSYDMPVLVKNSLSQKDYWMPDINEQVLCLFLPVGIEQGYIIGSFYSDVTAPPAADKNIRKVQFQDGTAIEYDRSTHTLKVDITETSGQVIINCPGKVTVNSPAIDLGESAALEPSVLGDKIAEALDALRSELDNHQHIGNLGAPTSPAMQVKPFEFIDLLSGGASYSTKNRNQ